MYPLLVSCGVSGFGQHRHPDATLSLKWIDVNGSLLQSQMPQARTDRQPTSLSLSLSLPASRTLSLWHKMICHSEQEYALQGGRWHQFISAGLVQNIVSPSGRKQIKQTRGQMESKEGKREEKRTKKNKQWDSFCRPLQSGERIHAEMKCTVQIKQPENHHLWAAAEIRPLSSSLQSACTSQYRSVPHRIPLGARLRHHESSSSSDYPSAINLSLTPSHSSSSI